MRSIVAALRTLVLPWGAPPGTPHRVIGIAVPAELVAFFATFGTGYVVVHADLWYFDGGDYYWEALLDTHTGDAFERGHPTGFCSSGVVEMFAMLNFDVTTGNVVRYNVGQFGTSYELIVGDFVTNVFDSLLALGTQADFTIDGTTQPRGFKGIAQANTSTAAIAAGTETVVLTISGFVARQGRAYRIDWGSRLTFSAAGNTGHIRVRKTNAAGTIIVDRLEYPSSAAAQQIACIGHAFMVRTAGSDATFDVVLTLDCNAGTVVHFGDSPRKRYIMITDVGAATDFTQGTVI